MDKSHARIIWDCSWSSEGDVFATASRDKTVRTMRERAQLPCSNLTHHQVKVWAPDPGSNRWPALATLKFKEAATAVAFCPIDNDG